LRGMGLAMDVVIFGGDTAKVAGVAAAVNAGVAVQDFLPHAGPRQADAIIVTMHGREVHDDGEFAGAVGILAHEGHDAVVLVGAIDPVEAVEFVIGFEERGFGEIETVQVLDKTLKPPVERTLIEEMPVEAGVGVPFGALAEFAAHEEKLFAGKHPLIAEQGAEVGEREPVIAGHAAYE